MSFGTRIDASSRAPWDPNVSRGGKAARGLDVDRNDRHSHSPPQPITVRLNQLLGRLEVAWAESAAMSSEGERGERAKENAVASAAVRDLPSLGAENCKQSIQAGASCTSLPEKDGRLWDKVTLLEEARRMYERKRVEKEKAMKVMLAEHKKSVGELQRRIFNLERDKDVLAEAYEEKQKEYEEVSRMRDSMKEKLGAQSLEARSRDVQSARERAEQEEKHLWAQEEGWKGDVKRLEETDRQIAALAERRTRLKKELMSVRSESASVGEEAEEMEAMRLEVDAALRDVEKKGMALMLGDEERRRIRVEAASGMQSQLDEARRILESERAARVEAEARLDAVKEEAAARLEAAESRMNSFRAEAAQRRLEEMHEVEAVRASHEVEAVRSSQGERGRDDGAEDADESVRLETERIAQELEERSRKEEAGILSQIERQTLLGEKASAKERMLLDHLERAYALNAELESELEGLLRETGTGLTLCMNETGGSAKKGGRTPKAKRAVGAAPASFSASLPLTPTPPPPRPPHHGRGRGVKGDVLSDSDSRGVDDAEESSGAEEISLPQNRWRQASHASRGRRGVNDLRRNLEDLRKLREGFAERAGRRPR